MERDDRGTAGKNICLSCKKIFVTHTKIFTGAKGGPGGCRHHHHVRARAGCGLHDALHEPGRDDPLQEADQEGSQFVLLPISAVF